MSTDLERQLLLGSSQIRELVEAAEAYRQAVNENVNARELARTAREQYEQAERESGLADQNAREAFDHLVNVVLGRDES